MHFLFGLCDEWLNSWLHIYHTGAQLAVGRRILRVFRDWRSCGWPSPLVLVIMGTDSWRRRLVLRYMHLLDCSFWWELDRVLALGIHNLLLKQVYAASLADDESLGPCVEVLFVRWDCVSDEFHVRIFDCSNIICYSTDKLRAVQV